MKGRERKGLMAGCKGGRGVCFKLPSRSSYTSSFCRDLQRADPHYLMLPHRQRGFICVNSCKLKFKKEIDFCLSLFLSPAPPSSDTSVTKEK